MSDLLFDWFGFNQTTNLQRCRLRSKQSNQIKAWYTYKTSLTRYESILWLLDIGEIVLNWQYWSHSLNERICIVSKQGCFA